MKNFITQIQLANKLNLYIVILFFVFAQILFAEFVSFDEFNYKIDFPEGFEVKEVSSN